MSGQGEMWRGIGIVLFIMACILVIILIPGFVFIYLSAQGKVNSPIPLCIFTLIMLVYIIYICMGIRDGGVELSIPVFFYSILLALPYLISFLSAKKYIADNESLLIIISIIIVRLFRVYENSKNLLELFGSENPLIREAEKYGTAFDYSYTYNEKINKREVHITIFNVKIMPINESRISLMEASGMGNTETVRLLIEAGADVNVQTSDGETALMEAARRSDTEIIKLLLDKGADVNIKNDKGETALYQASRWERAEIVKLLIEAGADVNVQTSDGETALYWATTLGCAETVKLLKDAGAKE